MLQKSLYLCFCLVLVFNLVTCEEEKKPEPKPKPKINPITELINDAKRLGDEEHKYDEALEKLNKAKGYDKDSPGQEEAVFKPTAEQKEEIEMLIKKYSGLKKINDVIGEADELGQAGKCKEALEKLNAAKANADPQPTPKQIEEIDELIKKYTDCANPPKVEKPKVLDKDAGYKVWNPGKGTWEKSDW